eukprot:GHVS01100424.1.p1 GENE.GHVS01100424.1~~GHVS01100424.1.p1  ORF type:complete len:912 (-),score=200.09 GHVS01100424.1:1545-4280(-)
MAVVVVRWVVCLLLCSYSLFSISHAAFEGVEEHELSERLSSRLAVVEGEEMLNEKMVSVGEMLGISHDKEEEEEVGGGGGSAADKSLRGHDDKVCTSSECERVATMMKAHMNASANPCDDVDNFICGGWRDSFELPDDESGWTISFDSIANKTRLTIKSILEENSCQKLKDIVKNNSDKHGSSRNVADSAAAVELPPTSSSHGVDEQFDRWDALSTCIYESCMDTDSLDELGASPMMNLLFEQGTTDSNNNLRWLVESKFDEEAEQLPTVEDRRELFSSRMFDFASQLQDVQLWGFYVGLNTLSPDKHQTVRIYGSGLGLSYHFYDAKHTDVQSQYREHLSNLLKLFEEDLATYDADLFNSYVQNNPNRRQYTTEQRVDRIFEFEFSLREIMLSPEESRDVVKYTNGVTYADLKRSSPLLDVGRIIDHFMSKVNKTVADDHQLLIHEVNYFKQLADKLQGEDWAVIFDYMLVHTVSGYASMLGERWRQEKENYKRKRSGAEPLPRWRTCRLSPPSWIMSRRYVKEKFDSRRKDMTKDLVKDLKKAFRKMLKNYEWMSEDTEKLAQRKLSKMAEKIAYPEWLEDDFEDYFSKYYGTAEAAFEQLQHSYFAVKLHLGRMSTLYELSQFLQPQDLTEWHMNPQSVNAYYSPSSNQIAFMAAILEEPSVFVWDTKKGGRAEEVVMKTLTYGGIGGIIGHEITHGFDDKGKDYDVDGKLHKWWSESSEKNFAEKAQCVEEQYGAYSVDLAIENDDGDVNNLTLNVRGSLTLGENIADNGGVQIAWEALKLKLTEKELNARPLSMFGVDMTTTQLFMFAWGHFWCSKNRPKSVRRRIETDPHSPDEFRTEGPLANFGLFAEVFDCPLGSPMNRPDVCRVCTHTLCVWVCALLHSHCCVGVCTVALTHCCVCVCAVLH